LGIKLDDKPKPKIERQEDIILKVTKTALCGSDLHLYHGSIEGMEPGQTGMSLWELLKKRVPKFMKLSKVIEWFFPLTLIVDDVGIVAM
jgi:hypothetical protein